MKITLDEVRHVAALARLDLSPSEEETLAQQLDRILQYVEKLSQLDTEGMEPLAHAVSVVNGFREDRVTNEPASPKFLAQAPAREKRFFKVPKIIE